MRKSRIRLAKFAGLVLAIGLSGCSSEVCPAIAYIHGLTVELGGETPAAAQVQLCTDEGCAPADDVDQTGSQGLVRVVGHDENTWQFDLDRTFDALTVRTLAADGTVLSDTLVTPEWVRVNGSAQCGGRHEAIVEVEV